MRNPPGMAHRTIQASWSCTNILEPSGCCSTYAKDGEQVAGRILRTHRENIGRSGSPGMCQYDGASEASSNVHSPGKNRTSRKSRDVRGPSAHTLAFTHNAAQGVYPPSQIARLPCTHTFALTHNAVRGSLR